MRIKRVVLLAFLMMLYITPAIFAPSFTAFTSPTEPNMNKEFSAAAYLDESPESITNFSETLDDDVLFYPDALGLDPRVADSGEDDYQDSFVIDTTTWAAEDSREYAEFDFPDNGQIETISYSLYGCGYDGDGYFHVWNGSDWLLLETLAETEEVHSWYNGTFTDSACGLSGNIIRLGIIGEGMWQYATVDYLEVSIEYMTLADSDHWFESFADVSDWTVSAGATPTSDNDLGTFTAPSDYLWDIYYSNDPSALAVQYLEVNYAVNVTTSDVVQVLLYSADDRGGSLLWSQQIGHSTTAQTTHKYYAGVIGVECVVISLRCTSAIEATFDYLRAGPATEMGWQHDCSTTTGTDASSSDGDLINVTSSITFDIDTTTTVALIETTYYPFIDVLVDDGSGNIVVETSADGSSWSTIVSSTAISADTHYRGNVLATGTDVKEVRVNVTSWATLDLCQLDSIANFTVTQHANIPTDHYFYVDENSALNRVGEHASNYYLTINHDPALSVDTSTYNVWNVTRSGLSSNTDWDRWNLYIDGAWDGWTDTAETRGVLTSGTMTDFQMLTYNQVTISEIKFIDNHTWHEIDVITIYFYVPFDYWALNMGLIFGGLALVVVSACVLAVWIRNKNIDTNKGFMFLLMFMLGWGLFLGGTLLG